MRQRKLFILIISAFLVLASCTVKVDPAKFYPMDLTGNWKSSSSSDSFSLSSLGKISLSSGSLQANLNITTWSSDSYQYDYSYTIAGTFGSIGYVKFNFTSKTECQVTITSLGISVTQKFVKQ